MTSTYCCRRQFVLSYSKHLLHPVSWVSREIFVSSSVLLATFIFNHSVMKSNIVSCVYFLAEYQFTCSRCEEEYTYNMSPDGELYEAPCTYHPKKPFQRYSKYCKIQIMKKPHPHLCSKFMLRIAFCFLFVLVNMCYTNSLHNSNSIIKPMQPQLEQTIYVLFQIRRKNITSAVSSPKEAQVVHSIP